MSSVIGSSVRHIVASCVVAVVVLIALPSAASAASTEPIARSTCTAPGLTCDPCPATKTHCSAPTGRVGSNVPVDFDGRNSTDDRGGIVSGMVVSWEWTFGDGTTGTGSQISHAFTTAGTYNVSLEVFDDDGLSDTHMLSIVVSPAAIATLASPGVVLGGAVLDQATVTGRVNPQPGETIAFRLYGPDDAMCSGTPVFSATVPYTTTGGTVPSPTYAPTAAGTYRWIATFSGDANNPPVPNVCDAAGTTVVVTAPPPQPPAPVVVAPPPPPAVVKTVAAVPKPRCLGRIATIVATPGSAVIMGTSGADVIVGGDRSETIDGRGGNDTICGGKGNDTIRGSGGNDKISGGSGDDLLLGGVGDDDLRGDAGNDRLGGGEDTDRVDGGAGNDLLDEDRLGSGGRDRLLGGSGNDRIRTSDGTVDSIDCGSGRDRAFVDRRDKRTNCETVTFRTKT